MIIYNTFTYFIILENENYLLYLYMRSFDKELAVEIFNVISNKYDYDSISQFIQDKKFINNTNRFLSKLGISISNLRIFLTSFLIKYCPEDVFIERQEVEENLIQKSSNIIGIYKSVLVIDEVNESLVVTFEKEVNNFIKTFNNWKINDKKKLVFILSSSYQELNLTVEILKKDDNDFSKKWISEIASQKKSLENYIYKIGGENAIDKLMEGSFWMDIMTPEMIESVENKTKLKLHDEMIQELTIDGKKPFLVMKLLGEIRKKLGKNPVFARKIERDGKIEILNMDLPKCDVNKIVKIIIENYLEMINSKELTESAQLDSPENLVQIMEKINLTLK